MICQSFILCLSKRFRPRVAHHLSFVLLHLHLLWHPEHTRQWEARKCLKKKGNARDYTKKSASGITRGQEHIQWRKRVYLSAESQAKWCRTKELHNARRLMRGTCSIWDFYSKYRLSSKNTRNWTSIFCQVLFKLL